MKFKLKKISAAIFAALIVSSTNADPLSGVLDGMFANVTAPDVVSNQFRGSISLGSAYIRSPISSLNLIALDPPRLSMGCGGIDMYLGAFSFITAEKLTQFIRNVAQNAAPLAFKMAIDAVFPQLGGILDKFQSIAQKMNDMNMNSCAMAHGLLNQLPTLPKSGAMEGISQTISSGLDTVSATVSDWSDGLTKFQADPVSKVKGMREARDVNGNAVNTEFGNHTWDAIKNKTNLGLTLDIVGDSLIAKQILMSLIGSSVVWEQGTPDAPQEIKPTKIPATLQLSELFSPKIGNNGIQAITMLNCDEIEKCQTPTPKNYAMTGITGYVNLKMMGSTDGTLTNGNGSIVDILKNCNSDKCGMTPSQFNFLNAIGNVGAVAMLMKAQRVGDTIGGIAPELTREMVTEVSIVYGNAVIKTAMMIYSDSKSTPPEGFKETIAAMRVTIADLEKESFKNIEKLHVMGAYIDQAIIWNAPAVRYKAAGLK